MRRLLRPAMTKRGIWEEVSTSHMTSNSYLFTTYHIDDGKYTGAVSELLCIGGKWLIPVNANNAESNIRSQVSREEEKLKSGRQRSHVQGRRQLEFTIMSLAENRCIQKMLFEARPLVLWNGEIALRIVVQARQGANVFHGFHAHAP